MAVPKVPMSQCPVPFRITENVPMAHVADVDRSADFYSLLGFDCTNRFSGADGTTNWASMHSGSARMMLARASGPVCAHEQAVLFYMYSSDVRALRAHLLQHGLPNAGLPPGEIGGNTEGPVGAAVYELIHPFYMPEGELRVHDPDGYCILIGQLG